MPKLSILDDLDKPHFVIFISANQFFQLLIQFVFQLFQRGDTEGVILKYSEAFALGKEIKSDHY